MNTTQGISLGVITALAIVIVFLLFGNRDETDKLVPPTPPTTQTQTSNATSSAVETTLGIKVDTQYSSITPLHVVEDSRCPEGVQCIQAGTVKISTRIDTGMGPAFETLEIGKPITTEVEQITLINVTPAPNADKELHPSVYRFTFEIKPRSE